MRARWFGAALVALLLTSGCAYRGAASLPLPGAVSADDGYAVRIVFADAANLVRDETCRSNDAVVGSVESITLRSDLKAEVVCRVRNDVSLPANVTAVVRQTSLLGERFVSLELPSGAAAQGTLGHNAEIAASLTRADPDTEMALSALSSVLNGGGLANIQTITRELGTALQKSDARTAIKRLTSVVSTFNANRQSITQSLDALDRFSSQLAAQRQVLSRALASIPGGLAVLDRQRPALVSTLTALSRLSKTAVPLLRKTQATTQADLRHLQPVLSQLASVGEKLPDTIRSVVAWPFPPTALSAIKGDYGGMYLTLSLGLNTLDPLLKLPQSSLPTTPAHTGVPFPSLLPNPLAPLTSSIPSKLPADAGVDQLLGGLLGGAK